jgi:hypothetical protein
MFEAVNSPFFTPDETAASLGRQQEKQPGKDAI